MTADNTIDGGAGTDTPSIASAATAATVSGFETLTATEATNRSQDMAVFLDNTTFTKVNSSLTADAYTLALTNVRAGITTRAATTATATTLARLIDTITNSLTVNVTGGQTITGITASNEETTNSASTNSSAVVVTALTATDLSTLNITGSGAVTITTLGANSTTAASTMTINASRNTGGVHLDASNGTIVGTITGSATVENTQKETAGGDTIIGGTGADKIYVDNCGTKEVQPFS